MDLQERNVLVIGGAGGIGSEIVRSLVSRNISKLAVIGSSKEPKAALSEVAKNVDVQYRQGAVDNNAELKKVMEELSSKMGGFDIIINSAGYLDERNPSTTIAVNYNGVVNSTLMGIELMRKDKGGRGGQIINIASITSLLHNIIHPVYIGTKHAVLSFTKSLHNASFYEKTGITFISVLPGITKTPLIGNFHESILFPEMTEECKGIASNFHAQDAHVVGKCVLQAIDDNENGSVWRVENNRIEKIQLHEYPRF